LSPIKRKMGYLDQILMRQRLGVLRLEPAGLAFEMIPEGSEEGIEIFREEGGTPRDIGPAIGWDRLGWPSWELYRPIFEAAPEAYYSGGAASTGELMTAIRDSAATAFGPGAERYGLDILLDARLQAEVEEEMVVAHCNKLPRSAARGMAEAQRLRDARFADAVVRASAAGGGRAVLITGNGHARTDRGVPAYLRISVSEMSVLSLGQIEVVPEVVDIQDYLGDPGLPYDYVWFSARAERPDPCASFN
ncbi:MAG: ChaN family lipoprotein, partial [Pseudomonadota bacterium]